MLWGDHGWHLGEKQHWRKFALWEEATRAPLIWVVPGLTPRGKICEATVDFMSLYPTLCDLASLPVPGHCKGVSLRKLLGDPDTQWDRPARTTYGRNRHAIRSKDFRYIRYDDGSEELYDENADPYEWTNLAGQTKYADTIASHKKWLPEINVPQAPSKKKD